MVTFANTESLSSLNNLNGVLYKLYHDVVKELALLPLMTTQIPNNEKYCMKMSKTVWIQVRSQNFHSLLQLQVYLDLLRKKKIQSKQRESDKI